MIPERFKIPEQTTPFHILSIEGLDKSGKTDLSLRAPGPIALQSWDFGTAGVVEKYAAEKMILVAEYTVNVDASIDFDFRKRELKERAEESADQQGTRVKKESWNPFVGDYLNIISDPSIRTVVWDSASEVNEIIRLANFGKLERNSQIAYGPINTDFKMLVRRAHEFRKNLILIHQLAPEYKTVTDPTTGKDKSIETGNLKRRGNNAIGYLVHSYVRTEKVPPTRDRAGNVTKAPEFHVKIVQARLNPEADGMVLVNPDWVSLMMILAPSVPAESWL